MDQLITSSSISCRADSVCGKYLFMQHDCNIKFLIDTCAVQTNKSLFADFQPEDGCRQVPNSWDQIEQWEHSFARKYGDLPF